MTEAYLTDPASGNLNAIAAMVEFYGGPGTFDSWPPKLRAYSAETTTVNIVDWAPSYRFTITASAPAQLELPVLVARGGESHPAVQRANELLAKYVRQGRPATIESAAHFMIASHFEEVADLISGHVHSVPDRC